MDNGWLDAAPPAPDAALVGGLQLIVQLLGDALAQLVAECPLIPDSEVA